jgi:hypothetical protein
VSWKYRMLTYIMALSQQSGTVIDYECEGGCE